MWSSLSLLPLHYYLGAYITGYKNRGVSRNKDDERKDKKIYILEILKYDQVRGILRSSNKCKADFDKSLNYCLRFLENLMLAFS